jgi:uncharacterized protein (DUF2249 family)
VSRQALSLSKGKEQECFTGFACRSTTKPADKCLFDVRRSSRAAHDRQTSIEESDRMTVAEDHILKLDVREIPRPERHPRIFGMLNSLLPDYELILTVDHDPVPLSYHLEMHYDGMFEWEYLSRGPVIWEVRIRRKKHEGCNCNCGGSH